MNIQPPKWIDRVLSRIMKHELQEQMIGDMHEEFYDLVEKRGTLIARTIYLLMAMDHVRIFGARIKFIKNQGMFFNQVKVGFRQIKKHKNHAFINIGGLAVGISFCLLSFMYITYELTYDKFHPDDDQLYRVATAINFRGPDIIEGTPYPLKTAINLNVEDVAVASRYIPCRGVQVSINATDISEQVTMVSPSFFEITHFPAAYGIQPEFLKPFEVLITEQVANSYFSSRDPVGLTLELRQDSIVHEFVVAGVLQAPPTNSSFELSFVISDEHFGDYFGQDAVENWRAFKSPVVTIIKSQLPVEIIEMQLNQVATLSGLGEIMHTDTLQRMLPVQRLDHLHFQNEASMLVLHPPVNHLYVKLFILISCVVLLIACFNFVNMSFAMVSRRVAEVGVRKVLGANKSTIIEQFYVEYLLQILLAISIAFAISVLVLPTFSAFIGKSLTYPSLITLLAGIGLISLISVLFIGTYPALLLSRVGPLQLFKNTSAPGRHLGLTKVLTSVQLAVVIVLLISSVSFKQQLSNIERYDLGYNSSHIVMQEFTLKDAISDQEVQLFKTKALPFGKVKGVSASRGNLVGDTPGSMWQLRYQEEILAVAALKVDYDYLGLLEIPLLKGRNFDPENASDPTGSVIVNEKFIDFFDLDDQIIGHTPSIFGEGGPRVIGIVADYHFQSLRKGIEPLILNLRPDSKNSELYVRIDGNNLSQSLEELEGGYLSAFPNSTPNFQFLDDKILDQYKNEQRWRTAISFASIFAMFLVLLGLLGLSKIYLSIRTKELGIRKVLGADSFALFAIQARNFGVLLAVSLLFVIPGAWLSTSWINEMFYVQSAISLQTFLLPLLGIFLLLLIVTIAEISFINQVKPVNVLKEE